MALPPEEKMKDIVVGVVILLLALTSMWLLRLVMLVAGGIFILKGIIKGGKGLKN